MNIEDEYLDVLQNIEFGIISTYKKRGDFSDHSVMRALEAAIDYYVAKKIKREPRDFNLNEAEEDIFDSVVAMCDLRLGEANLETKDGEQISLSDEPLTVQEIIDCLKQILKSANFWNKQSGRTGYLEYASKFI